MKRKCEGRKLWEVGNDGLVGVEALFEKVVDGVKHFVMSGIVPSLSLSHTHTNTHTYSTITQSIRVKLVQNTSAMERRFSPWIGGSIIASLVHFLLASNMSLPSRFQCNPAIIAYVSINFSDSQSSVKVNANNGSR